VEPQNFPQPQPNDPNYSSQLQILRRSMDMLENIWSTLAFKVDLRKIKQKNINMFESDLREVLSEIQKIRRSPLSLLGSMEAVHENITHAIDKLYRASLFEQKSTAEEMDSFIQAIRESQQFIYSALEECNLLMSEE
jgi:hypothetical protein